MNKDDFFGAIKICMSKYLNLNGRASRSEYWYFFLFTFLLTGVLNGFGSGGGTAIGSFASLVLFLPSLMVAIRRMHDINRSGYWLLWVLLPVVGWIYVIYNLAQPGTVGENDYGSPSDDFAPTGHGSNDDISLHYEDLPQTEAAADAADEPQTTDRYGREIKDDGSKPKGKGKSDFLKG
ncbi:MAG: DUF805 domain-containing protein [Hyphomicrobiales bacterium]|nr:DUF805 domain-containing protein [Hyphomicrobiales bacterium]